MYDPAVIKKDILDIIARESISKLSDIFRFSDFGKSVIYRNKFNKDSEILELIKQNRINQKTALIKSKADEILEIRDKALEILRSSETVGGEEKRKNGIIYRIDFLCAKLHISTATFYEYNLNEDQEIRIELDINREAVKIDGYSRLLNSKQATGVLAFIKLVGNDEERKRIATTYQEIKQNTKIELTLADEIKELISNEYIEEKDEFEDAQIIDSSDGSENKL